jgi:hypothetical protein
VLEIATSEGELIRRALGAQWSRLHPDIQQRFNRNPPPGHRLYYTGTLSELTCSRLGRVLAWMTQPLVRGALIPVTDYNFPVDIEVFSRPGDPAIFKQRTYRLNGRKPVQFTSRMVGHDAERLIEYVGAGLGMVLSLSVDDGNLTFESERYFIELFGLRIRLPGVLTPGKTHLVHRNESPGSFSIRIDIRHALFGTTFTQAGEFHEIAEPRVAA